MSLNRAYLNTVVYLFDILPDAQSWYTILSGNKIPQVQITISLCPTIANFLKFFLFTDVFKNYFQYKICDGISTSFRDMI